MSLITQLIVAWFAVNLLILALMWHSAEVRRRRRKAYEQEVAAAPAPQLPPQRPRPHLALAAQTQRVVLMVNGDTSGPSLTREAPARHAGAAQTGCAPGCDCEALRAEIRSLRLSVAELSIDRARLLAKSAPKLPSRPAPTPRPAHPPVMNSRLHFQLGGTAPQASASEPAAINPAPAADIRLPSTTAWAALHTPSGITPTTDELGKPVGQAHPPESKHTFVLHWHIDTVRFEDGTLVYRVVGADFVHTDVCFFCRSEQEARTLLALVDGVCTTHTVIKTQAPR